MVGGIIWPLNQFDLILGMEYLDQDFAVCLLLNKLWILFEEFGGFPYFALLLLKFYRISKG